jgi:uncharacterized membrane protein
MGADAFLWLLVIFVLLIAMFIGVSWLRRYFRSSDTASPDEPFTLGDLRSMLKRGQISQEEYDRLREQIIAIAKKPTKPDKPLGPAGPEQTPLP